MVGLRYTRAKRRNHFISFISLISMAGIALGVAALIVVLSVMNGFQQELRARILSVVSHVQLTGPGDRIDGWQRVAQAAAAHPRVRDAAPFINAQGMITYGRGVRGAIVRGVVPELEDRVADIGRHMRSGRLEALRPGEFGIVLGGALARGIGAGIGDKVALIAPQGQVTPAGVIPRLKQFTVVGTFEIGMYEYDSSLALMHLEDAQRLFQTGSGVSGVRLKLDDLFAARAVARELTATLGNDVYASDWTRSHANFFRAVEIEKRVMFIILTLIVAVAAFNIVSTLVMLVTDKQADIAILRTLGAAPGSILQIFVVQGAMIGVIGTLCGVAGGVLLALNVDTVVPALETVLGFKFLSPEVYYISDLPSDVQPRDVAVIGVVSLVMSFVATLYPSWRAARVNPAEALRYE
ncbi:MAG TPA: lipoprotein-releasing ABC transporter permease subunit [Burkholderiales bacterium]